MAALDLSALASLLADAVTNASLAAQDQATDEQRTVAEAAARSAWQQVPVGFRAFAASLLLVATGARPTIVKVAERGDFSRGTFASNELWAPLLEALRSHPEGALLLLSGSPIATPDYAVTAAASAEVAKRDRTIAELRAEVTRLKATVGPLQRLVQELHAALFEATKHAPVTTLHDADGHTGPRRSPEA